jgi:nitric oxide reductase activation protein
MGGRSQIRYTAVPTDSAYVIDKMVPAFQIQRHEKVGASWNMTGGSSSYVTKFTIQLLDENSNVAVPTNARQVRVRIGNAVAVNPMSQQTEHNSLLAGREMKWGITLAPRGLRLQGYQG